MKRNILFIVYCLLVSITLVSCNLFIDDEYESLEMDDVQVPVHTGEGYDKPVTVIDKGCTVTYQYKSNVRVVSQEEQDRYIVFTKKDDVGGFIEIHYRGDTPKDKLPVPGEILMSGVTERFPWGCNHKVLNRFREGDVYIMVAGFSALVDTFEELDIQGEAVIQESRCVTRSSDDGFAWEKPKNTTRADEEGIVFSIDDKSGITDDGLDITTHFSGVTTKNVGSLVNTVEMKRESNTITFKGNFTFDDFSIKNKCFKCKYVETVEEKTEIKVSGGWKGNIMGDTKHIGSKVLVLGPVIVVLFADFYYSLDIALTLSKTFKEHTKTKTVYTIDFYEMTMVKDYKKLIDEPLEFKELAIETTLSFEFGIALGMGIYGKVLTVRILIGPVFSATATIAKNTEFYGDNKVKNLSDIPKVDIDVNLDFTFGVFLDLSLSALLGDYMSDTQRKKLEDYENAITKDSEYYKKMLDAETDYFDKVNANLSPKEKAKQKILGTDIAKTKSISYNWKKYFWTWYPYIKDGDYVVNVKWDDKNKRYKFTGRMTIEQEGIFSKFGTSYVPCLMLIDKKRPKSKPKYVFPIKGGKESVVKSGNTYHFDLEDMGDDIVYNIYPSYFKYPIPSSIGLPEAYDKGFPHCLTSPVLSVNKVEPLSFNITKDPEGYSDQYYDEEEKKYEYEYKWRVNTYSTIQGTYYMRNWWIFEQRNMEYYNPRKKDDSNTNLDELDNLKFGYEMYWTFLKYSHSYDENKELNLTFEPCFTRTDDKYEQFCFGEEVNYKLRGNSGSYDELYTARQTTTTNDGEKVVQQLDSIVKDGKLIWQRNGRNTGFMELSMKK